MKSTIEIILKKDVQQIFDEFSFCFDIRIGLMSPSGKEIAVGLKKPCNEFCTLIKNQLNRKDICLELDKEKRRTALVKNDMITYKCFAGMIETIFPIYYDGIHLGFVILGQYRHDEKLNQEIISEWQNEIGTAEKLIIAFLKTPSFSKEKIDNIKELFRVIVEYIASQNMIKIRSNLIIEKLINYAKNNMKKNVSITDASKIVLKSSSTISHIFTSYLNKSFKQVMIEIKLEKAEELLLKDHNITIKEVSYAIGYNDQYYFSRLYKKYRGFPPSNFKYKNI